MANPCGPDIPQRAAGEQGHLTDHNKLHCFYDSHIAGPNSHAAGAITNTPAGTIAATNVQSALNELDTEKANKSDLPYFTVSAPGGVDDTSIVQGAIDLANAASGGIVQLSHGTYVCTTLTLYSNVTINGTGVGSTILLLKNNTNGDLITTINFSVLTGGIAVVGAPVHFGLSNLTLDGNKANQTTGWPLRVFGSCYRIEEIEIVNGKSGGWWSEWGSAADADMESHINGFKIKSCDGAGLDWNGPHDSVFTNGHIFHNTGKGVNTGGQAGGEQFTNVHVWGVEHTWAWYLARVAVLTNCVGEGSQNANLMVGASRTIVIGGRFFVGNNEQIKLSDTGLGAVIGCQLLGLIINEVSSSNTDAPILFGNSGGTNFISATVYKQSSSALTSGSIGNSDTLLLNCPDDATVSVFKVGTYTQLTGLRNQMLTVRGANDYFNVNTNTGNVEVVNGGHLDVYSDNYTTRTFRVSAATGNIDTVAGITASAEISGLDVKATGLAGAIAASRYVGATASGSPVSGTFVIGDFVVDQSGQIWICTIAGTPGTWKGVGRNTVTDIQVFNTAGGTWTKPAGATSVSFILFGSGGGGASGRRGAAGTVRVGGGGGSGGGRYLLGPVPAANVPSSLTVSVQAGGSGGAAVTVNDTNGNNGTTQGGNTSVVGTNFALNAGFAAGGSGGTASAGAGGSALANYYGNSSGGGASGTGGAGSVGGNSSGGASGGGSGGGITSADAVSNGGNGGNQTAFGAAGQIAAAGVAPGGTGANGTVITNPPSVATGGNGGGGGASSITGAAGNGGTGGFPGGGGGGGGASLNGNNSGAGGAGADGVAIIITYF